MPKILMIHDTSLAMKPFKLLGFEIDYSISFSEAWSKISSACHYDLLLIEVTNPSEKGIDLCQKVRISGNDIPILILSEHYDERTVLKFIQSGANDYLRRPLGIDDLKFRIQRLIKKLMPQLLPLQYGELTIDPRKRNVTLMGKNITMGKKEINILLLLTKRAGEIVTRETIIDAIYDHPDLIDRTIDSHISHLRKKIYKISGENLLISSIYGLGYRLHWNK